MPGTRSNAFPVHGLLTAYSAAAVTVSTLTEAVMVFPGRIGAIKVYAGAVGTGAVVTVMDVTLNGTSIWTTGTNRPSLVASSLGEFANTAPDTRAFQPGDRIAITCAAATTAQTRVMVSIGLELA